MSDRESEFLAEEDTKVLVLKKVNFLIVPKPRIFEQLN